MGTASALSRSAMLNKIEPLRGNIMPAASNALAHGRREVVVYAHHLAGGLHLRPKVGIHFGQLGHGEYGRLDPYQSLAFPQAHAVAQIAQGRAPASS